MSSWLVLGQPCSAKIRFARSCRQCRRYHSAAASRSIAAHGLLALAQPLRFSSSK